MINSNKHIPIRTCVICRNKFPQTDLLRYGIKDEDTNQQAVRFTLFIDNKNRLGRGFYVCAEEKCRAKMDNFQPRRKKYRG